MICLVLLKNNLINNEASKIRIKTASAQQAVLPEQDGKGLKWVERCQVSHSPVLCWMDKSRKSIGREKEEVGSVRPRSTLWQICLKNHFSPWPSYLGRTTGLAEAVSILMLLASLLIRLFFKRTKQIIQSESKSIKQWLWFSPFSTVQKW